MNGDDSCILDVSRPVVAGRHVLEAGRYTCERLDIGGSDLPVRAIRGDHETKSKANIEEQSQYRSQRFSDLYPV